MVRRITTGIARAFAWLAFGCSFDAGGFDSVTGVPGGDSTSSTTSGGEESSSTTSRPIPPETSSDGEGTPDGTTTSSSPVGDTSSDSGTEDTSTGAPAEDPCDPAQVDLVACYLFEGVGTGMLIDGSSHQNHGTAVGVGTEESPYGTAVLVGADAALTVPDSPSLDIAGALTIEAFLRRDAATTDRRQGIVDDDGQYGLFVTADGQILCAGGGVQAFAPAPALQAWGHVVCVFDGAAVTVFVDGVAGQSVPYGGVLSTDAVNPTAIGDGSPGWTEPLVGALARVRLWNTPHPPGG